jgi:hypothetical protein
MAVLDKKQLDVYSSLVSEKLKMQRSMVADFYEHQHRDSTPVPNHDHQYDCCCCCCCLTAAAASLRASRIPGTWQLSTEINNGHTFSQFFKPSSRPVVMVQE